MKIILTLLALFVLCNPVDTDNTTCPICLDSGLKSSSYLSSTYIDTLYFEDTTRIITIENYRCSNGHYYAEIE